MVATKNLVKIAPLLLKVLLELYQFVAARDYRNLPHCTPMLERCIP